MGGRVCVKLREAGLQADGQSARAGEPLEGRWGHTGSGVAGWVDWILGG